ncbi:MAG: hypothetical protein AAGJ35_09520 [Myxococcota bacterium]
MTDIDETNVGVIGKEKLSDEELIEKAKADWQAFRQREMRLEKRSKGAHEDARLLCRMGWLKFLLGKERQATQALKKGVEILRKAKRDEDKVLLGACLYSLGRVQEWGHNVDDP